MPLDKGKVIEVLKEDFATEFTYLIYLLCYLYLYVINMRKNEVIDF